MSVINSYNKDSSPPKSLLLLDKSAVFIEQHINSTYMYYSTTPTHVTWKSLYVFVDTDSRAWYKACMWSLGSVSIQEPTSLVCVFFFHETKTSIVEISQQAPSRWDQYWWVSDKHIAWTNARSVLGKNICQNSLDAFQVVSGSSFEREKNTFAFS